MTRIAGALVALLCATASAHAQRSGFGVPLTKVPRILISVSQSGDARVPLVHAAVAHWNGILAGTGSGFRLGPVSLGGGSGQSGAIVVVLSDAEFVSHVIRQTINNFNKLYGDF